MLYNGQFLIIEVVSRKEVVRSTEYSIPPLNELLSVVITNHKLLEPIRNQQ